MSVQPPTDERLCRKLSKLNLTLVEGYPSCSSETGGLQKDQFVKLARSQAKWYGLHSNQKKDTSDCVSSWNTDSCKLNSTYLRIGRQAEITSNPPQSRPISQESLCKVATVTDELQYLLDFNSSICQPMAKSMEHLMDFVFVNMANLTLNRRDSSLSYLKAGIKADTLVALRAAPYI